MNKKEFVSFCNDDFISRNYKKVKNMYYLKGTHGVLSGIKLQKSCYGEIYYVNYYFFIGNYENVLDSQYPTSYEYDVYGRILVLSKATQNGSFFETGGIEYEKYTREELRNYFDKAFQERILPPVCIGKKYLLHNLNKLYFLDLRQDEVMKKLMGT